MISLLRITDRTCREKSTAYKRPFAAIPLIYNRIGYKWHSSAHSRKFQLGRIQYFLYQNLINNGNTIKIVLRKKSYVLYVKEGAQIVDMLAIMEANVALMDLENIRILKEMRNSVVR